VKVSDSMELNECDELDERMIHKSYAAAGLLSRSTTKRCAARIGNDVASSIEKIARYFSERTARKAVSRFSKRKE
jgi:hypothetical protein